MLYTELTIVLLIGDRYIFIQPCESKGILTSHNGHYLWFCGRYKLRALNPLRENQIKLLILGIEPLLAYMQMYM